MGEDDAAALLPPEPNKGVSTVKIQSVFLLLSLLLSVTGLAATVSPGPPALWGEWDEFQTIIGPVNSNKMGGGSTGNGHTNECILLVHLRGPNPNTGRLMTARYETRVNLVTEGRITYCAGVPLAPYASMEVVTRAATALARQGPLRQVPGDFGNIPYECTSTVIYRAGTLNAGSSYAPCEIGPPVRNCTIQVPRALEHPTSSSGNVVSSVELYAWVACTAPTSVTVDVSNPNVSLVDGDRKVASVIYVDRPGSTSVHTTVGAPTPITVGSSIHTNALPGQYVGSSVLRMTWD